MICEATSILKTAGFVRVDAAAQGVIVSALAAYVLANNLARTPGWMSVPTLFFIANGKVVTFRGTVSKLTSAGETLWTHGAPGWMSVPTQLFLANGKVVTTREGMT